MRYVSFLSANNLRRKWWTWSAYENHAWAHSSGAPSFIGWSSFPLLLTQTAINAIAVIAVFPRRNILLNNQNKLHKKWVPFSDGDHFGRPIIRAIGRVATKWISFCQQLNIIPIGHFPINSLSNLCHRIDNRTQTSTLVCLSKKLNCFW